MRRIVILAVLTLLAACGDDTRTASGVTKAEADGLDEAAEIIEQQRLPAGAVQPEADQAEGAQAAEPAASDMPKSGG